MGSYATIPNVFFTPYWAAWQPRASRPRTKGGGPLLPFGEFPVVCATIKSVGILQIRAIRTRQFYIGETGPDTMKATMPQLFSWPQSRSPIENLAALLYWECSTLVMAHNPTTKPRFSEAVDRLPIKTPEEVERCNGMDGKRPLCSSLLP